MRIATIGGAFGAALSTPCSAQELCLKTFRLIRLCEVPDPDVSGIPEGADALYGADNTFGIYDHGQVVGTMRWITPANSGCGSISHQLSDGTFERLFAFLWTPRPEMGIPVAGDDGCNDHVHNLHTLAGFPTTEFSFANAISTPADDGTGNIVCYAVGARLCTENTAQAVAFRIHSYSPGLPPSIGWTDVTPAGSVGAYAYGVTQPMQLNTSTTPYEVAIVGKRGVGCTANVEGFIRYLGPAGISLPIALMPFSAPARSAAVDAIGPMTAGPPTHWVVGYDAPIPNPPCAQNSIGSDSCMGSGIDANYWVGLSYLPGQPTENYPGGMGDGQMRGGNPQGMSTGWANSLAGPQCARHAVVWGAQAYDITADPTDSRKSRSEAISPPDVVNLTTVVGWAPALQRGLVWRGLPGGTWCESDATDITANDVDCVLTDGSSCLPKTLGPNGAVVEIIQLHDINAFGHAVGIIRDTRFGSRGEVVSNKRFACVLGPVADLDEDLDVDAADLGILLGEWGNAISKANMFCSGVVDGDDLGTLVTSWSGSGVLSPAFAPWGSTCSCGSPGMMAAPGNSWDAEGALAALGFASIAEFAEWVESADELNVQAIILYLQQSIAAAQHPEL